MDNVPAETALCGDQNNASSRPCCQSQASAGVIENNVESMQQQSHKYLNVLTYLECAVEHQSQGHNV